MGDFPEEGLEFATKEEIIETIEGVLAKMNHLASSFEEGKKIHEGLSLALIGSPNVGKSSLMNALLGKDRAIVPTLRNNRDIIEQDLLLGKLHFRLIDTAGIRDTSETIEKEGIRRSKEVMKEADIILFLLDASREVSQEEYELLEKCPKAKTIVVWNKIDLPHGQLSNLEHEFHVEISAKHEKGLDHLKESIDRLIWGKSAPSAEEVVITSFRHKQSLERAIESCMQLVAGLRQDVSPEFLSSDMRATLQELGMIIGTNISEDILDSIFSKFCIGK